MLVRLDGRSEDGKSMPVWINPEEVTAVEDKSAPNWGKKKAYVHLQGAGIFVEGVTGAEVIEAFDEASKVEP